MGICHAMATAGQGNTRTRAYTRMHTRMHTLTHTVRSLRPPPPMPALTNPFLTHTHTHTDVHMRARTRTRTGMTSRTPSSATSWRPGG